MTDLNRFSQKLTQTRSQVGSQAMLYGTGMTEEQMTLRIPVDFKVVNSR